MVSVIGKEMVPYNANLHNDNSSSQSSSSSIVIESSPPTEEDSNAVARLSDFNNSSDSDFSLAPETIVNKPRQLALLPSPEDVLPSVDDIDEVDSSCVNEIMADHKCYPPQFTLGDPEDIPATREKLDYFLKMLQLKIKKYSKLNSCNIPNSLRNIPLALSYETFIKLYWPGAMSCCKKLFNGSQKYCDHYYKFHVPQMKIPSPPLNLSCVSAVAPSDGINEVEILSKASTSSTSTSQLVINESESSNDVISLDGSSDKSYVLPQPATSFLKALATQRPSPSNDNQSAVVRKRKTISPTSRPGPLCHKQVKLNQTIANVDSSMDSGDEKSANRPKRARRRYNSHDAFEKKSEEQMDELERDQMKYEPQHEPGAPENFIASAERLKYFGEVLALKLGKYAHMNMSRQTPTSTHIPLALSLTGFMQYYWPGKIICCGLLRENCQVLEKHITRSHRPPKPAPSMSVVMSQVDKNAFDEEASNFDDTETHQTKITSFLLPKGSKNETLEKSTSKSPPGFQADQHKYPPQHKPGEPEDFFANQESIDYFIEILTIKREKYAHMAPIKEKPLSSNWKDFVLHYWPGMMDCCDNVFASCKDFQSHFTSSHLPPKKMPCLKVVDASSIPTSSEPTPKNETLAATFSNPVTPSVPPVSPRSIRPSPSSQRQSDRLSIEPTPSRNETYSQSLSLLSTPSHLLMINSIYDEARQLKSRTGQVITMSALLPLLERLLELVGSIANRIRGTMEVEAISQATECLDYAWNASKTAILRWEDLKGRSNHDSFLSAVQFAYGTLPVFTSWEQRKHLEMLENIVLLSLNTVKNWQPPPSSPEAKMTSRQQTSGRRRTSKPPRMADVTISTNPEPSEDRVMLPGRTGAAVASTSDASVVDIGKEEKKNPVLDFCRLVNISTWQNTKSRASSGYKDDNGEYHALYRYGIGKVINLYCPTGVTHLKCCGKVFKLADLKTHVTQKHEDNGQANRTEPSISPA